MNYKLTPGSLIIRVDDGAGIPCDPENTDYATYLGWLAEGNTPTPLAEPTMDERIAANTAAIQAELDRQAQVKGYDDIVSACSYAAQPPGSPFQSEGAAFLKWRSDVWTHAYAVLADVRAGIVPMPTPAEAVAQMPALVLP